MSARDDHPILHMQERGGSVEAKKALDEIDYLRATVHVDRDAVIGELAIKLAAVNAALDQFYDEWPVEPPKFVKAVAEAVGR